MEKLITFITIIAWVMGVVSTVAFGLRVYGFFTYTELDKAMDAINGIHRRFPVMTSAITALVCWTWVLTFQVF